MEWRAETGQQQCTDGSMACLSSRQEEGPECLRTRQQEGGHHLPSQKAASVSSSACTSKSPVITQLPSGPLHTTGGGGDGDAAHCEAEVKVRSIDYGAAAQRASARERVWTKKVKRGGVRTRLKHACIALRDSQLIGTATMPNRAPDGTLWRSLLNPCSCSSSEPLATLQGMLGAIQGCTEDGGCHTAHLSRMRRSLPSCTFLSTAMVLRNCSTVMVCKAGAWCSKVSHVRSAGRLQPNHHHAAEMLSRPARRTA